MKIGLLTPWISHGGGGVAEAVIVLARTLHAAGQVEPVVVCLSERDDLEQRGRLAGIRIISDGWFGPRSFGFSPNLLLSLLRAEVDIVHLHGIWMWTSVVGLGWAASTGRPYVISPHGMLEPWILKRSPIKKALARNLYEGPSLRRANLLHALTDVEAESIRAFSPSAHVRVVPNGMEPVSASLDCADARSPEPYVLYLGRLHPKKNLEALLKAWQLATIGSSVMRTRLIIAGTGDEHYVKSLKALVTTLAIDSGVEFVGPVFGDEKARLLANAQWLALPSLSEGLPMVVLEAWNHGVPTLMTDACNLPDGFGCGAAVRIGDTPQTISVQLASALAEPATILRTRSDAARALVHRQFNANVIAGHWVNIYSGLRTQQATDAERRL